MTTRNLDEVEFTVFDVETTGLDPESGDRIVEIAAVRLKAEERLGAFHSLINPGRLISEAAFNVNHITQDMLKNAPDMNATLPRFLEFIKNSCLCSYNAVFDLGFINNELRLSGEPVLKDVMAVDILKMARRLLPGLERYALWFVADKLGIKNKQEHRASSDVELAIQAFNKLKENLKTKGISDYANFLSLFALDSAFLDDMNNQKIAEIQEAIGSGLKLKIKYLSSSSAQVSERDVVPKEIRQERNRTYLVGYCCLRNEERSFRVDGILHLEII